MNDGSVLWGSASLLCGLALSACTCGSTASGPELDRRTEDRGDGGLALDAGGPDTSRIEAAPPLQPARGEQASSASTAVEPRVRANVRPTLEIAVERCLPHERILKTGGVVQVPVFRIQRTLDHVERFEWMRAEPFAEMSTTAAECMQNVLAESVWQSPEILRQQESPQYRFRIREDGSEYVEYLLQASDEGKHE